jgi:hypothetical protein
MPYFIIETNDGWTIAELRVGRSAEEVALELGGTVLDPGPYDNYEDANDALLSLQEELADGAARSDTPGAHLLEGRETEN